MNALNKSFLDCILEVKKRDCIEDANDDESSMIDDEFFDCASPEHADDMNIENFSRSVISSFYLNSNSCVGLTTNLLQFHHRAIASNLCAIRNCLWSGTMALMCL